MLKPIYPFEPIGSIKLLALTLGTTPQHLEYIASESEKLYRLAKPIFKADGSIRQPLDALPPLKVLHTNLKTQVLARVKYPRYLTGSLKGSDYKVNAEQHINKRIVICEDITNFFPSITAARVRDIWQRFFGFPHPVAELLTRLTTKDSVLPQGAIPSSFLANLVLWRLEPALHCEFADRGFTYSRYVDDIAISSRDFLSKDAQTALIADVYGMLAKVGLRAKRKKHETYSASQRMITTKLVVNKKASLPEAKRSAIRAAVHRLEKMAKAEILSPEFLRELNRVAVQVGQMSRFHETQAAALKQRIAVLREARRANVGVVVQQALSPVDPEPDDVAAAALPPPW
jgi:hypothetical protein